MIRFCVGVFNDFMRFIVIFIEKESKIRKKLYMFKRNCMSRDRGFKDEGDFHNMRTRF